MIQPTRDLPKKAKPLLWLSNQHNHTLIVERITDIIMINNFLSLYFGKLLTENSSSCAKAKLIKLVSMAD